MTTGTGIIFLQKDKFDFYAPGLIKIIEFRFVPEIIHDLEIINLDLLEGLIKLFVESNKIAPTELLIVLADNACFIKDFVMPANAPTTLPPASSPVANPILDDAKNKIQVDSKSFIDHIPFENVTTRNFPMGNGTKVLAVNKDFYESIKSSFEKVGFKVKAVYPGVVFQNNVGTKPVMDIISANIILQQADMLRENNLLKEDKSIQPIAENKENENDKKGESKDFEVHETGEAPAKKSNKRLFLMIGVFVVLIVILVVVYIGSQQQPL